MFYPGTTILLLLFLVVQLNLNTAPPPPPKPERQYLKEHVCNETQETLQTVHHCPRDNETLQERSRKKMCHTFPKCKGETLVFHCVKWKNNLVEVCAPEGNITGFCCALFDFGVGRVVEDYNKPCPECPFNYLSTKSFLYATCVDLLNQKATLSKTTEVIDVISSNKPWSSTQATDVTAKSNDKTRKQTRFKDISRRSIHNASSEDENPNVPVVVIGALLSPVAVFAIGFTVGFCVIKRPLRSHSNQHFYFRVGRQTVRPNDT